MTFPVSSRIISKCGSFRDPNKQMSMGVKSGEQVGYFSSYPLNWEGFIGVASDVSVVVCWCAILVKVKLPLPIDVMNGR
jgi:hypothetical protein